MSGEIHGCCSRSLDELEEELCDAILERNLGRYFEGIFGKMCEGISRVISRVFFFWEFPKKTLQDFLKEFWKYSERIAGDFFEEIHERGVLEKKMFGGIKRNLLRNF